jgi:hypothetical protein
MDPHLQMSLVLRLHLGPPLAIIPVPVGARLSPSHAWCITNCGTIAPSFQ